MHPTTQSPLANAAPSTASSVAHGPAGPTNSGLQHGPLPGGEQLPLSSSLAALAPLLPGRPSDLSQQVAGSISEASSSLRTESVLPELLGASEGQDHKHGLPYSTAQAEGGQVWAGEHGALLQTAPFRIAGCEGRNWLLSCGGNQFRGQDAVDAPELTGSQPREKQEGPLLSRLPVSRL